MRSADVQEGFYYEKANRRGWLRLAVKVRGDTVTYIDFTGIGECTGFGRWAQRRLTLAEARAEFPREVAKISEQIAIVSAKAEATNFRARHS
ncbi:hypothetical protein CP49_12040 [Bradyrhizobium valentinum]|uniref:Uncharacterized protein n=2 Tax=Bradyrhizobium valentinum TaxID=1518501 RepID=A0A0R3KUR7_9BRAD|nr:hypothetical protein CP49_12040 [Bradyrhizobium valentinum]